MASRIFRINDIEYEFDFIVFKELFNKKHVNDKTPMGNLEEQLANFVSISKDSVHNWRNEVNGPGSIDIIKSIANFLNIKDYKTLLIKKGKEKNIMLNNLQIESLKRVYDSIIDFLERFDKTNGFNDLWCDLEIEPEFREEKLWNIANDEHERVMLTLKKEFFYLKDTKAYDELNNYIYNDLYDIYDGKLSYAYRFEADGESEPTTEQDYRKALNKLTDIISNYI